MRNRAKCLICNSVIESFHPTDYVVCKCGEIAVSDGAAMKAAAKDFSNFVRVDDNDNQIVVTVKDASETKEITGVDVNELIDELHRFVQQLDSLPPAAMRTPITHYDFSSVLAVICAILRQIKKP